MAAILIASGCPPRSYRYEMLVAADRLPLTSRSCCQLVGYNLEQACNRLSANNTSCAISQGLNIAHEPQQQHHNYLGLLPFALSKLEEPRTGLLQLLDEQWSIGRRAGGAALCAAIRDCHPRLDARTDGSWHSRPRPTGG